MNIKADPIIAVKNVQTSSKWYQTLLNCKDKHGGEKFAILTANDSSVLLCLHRWGEAEHPTMLIPKTTPGNGLILYFRTENFEEIRENAKKLGAQFEEDIYLNPNSTKEEFSLRDLDGYYIIISRYHEYEG